jgi:hypothetical protein
MALVISACGNDNSDAGDALVEETAAVDSGGTESNNSGGGSSAGTIDDAPPSGQAAASVDGQDFDFELPGGLACSISDDALTYSYRIGDNEVTLGAGVNRVDGGWMGNVSLQVANPVGEQGPIAYYPAPGEAGVLDESLLTVDGDTAVYVGPMLKQPANDGTQPPPVDVGSGRVIATC